MIGQPVPNRTNHTAAYAIFPPRAACPLRSLQIIRTIDSLQLTATRSLATPANWVPGGTCMVLPSVSPEAAADKFPEVLVT